MLGLYMFAVSCTVVPQASILDFPLMQLHFFIVVAEFPAHTWGQCVAILFKNSLIVRHNLLIILAGRVGIHVCFGFLLEIDERFSIVFGDSFVSMGLLVISAITRCTSTWSMLDHLWISGLLFLSSFICAVESRARKRLGQGVSRHVVLWCYLSMCADSIRIVIAADGRHCYSLPAVCSLWVLYTPLAAVIVWLSSQFQFLLLLLPSSTMEVEPGSD